MHFVEITQKNNECFDLAYVSHCGSRIISSMDLCDKWTVNTQTKRDCVCVEMSSWWKIWGISKRSTQFIQNYLWLCKTRGHCRWRSRIFIHTQSQSHTTFHTSTSVTLSHMFCLFHCLLASNWVVSQSQLVVVVVVVAGEMTEFGPSGFLGRSDIRGVSYAHPEYATLPGTTQNRQSLRSSPKRNKQTNKQIKWSI